MDRSTTTEKIIVIGLTVFAVVFWGYASLTMGQTKLSDVTIVSDVKPDTSKPLRIVTKDEIQRISYNSTLRMQKMEKDIKILKSNITHLQSQIKELEKKVEGG